MFWVHPVHPVVHPICCCNTLAETHLGPNTPAKAQIRRSEWQLADVNGPEGTKGLEAGPTVNSKVRLQPLLDWRV